MTEQEKLPGSQVSGEPERRLLGLFLDLPRKVQMLILSVVVGALAHLAGLDNSVVRAVFGTIAWEPENGKTDLIPKTVEPPGTRGFYAIARANVNPNRPYRRI